MKNEVIEGAEPTHVEELEILYRDELMTVINKPSGLVVHPSDMCRVEISAMSVLRDQVGHKVWPAHRLDRPTSGVLVFANNPEANSLLQKSFAEGRCKKLYLALVRGWMPEASGVLDYPLMKKNGSFQEGRSRWRRLAETTVNHPVGPYETARYSMVAVNPLAGRFRQIRRHFRDFAHPLIGDTSEGDVAHNRFFRSNYNCHRLLLHAHSLRLPDPRNRQRQLCLKAPLPEDFKLPAKELFPELFSTKV